MATRALPDLLAGGFDIVQVFKPYDFPLMAWARKAGGARGIYSSHGTDYFPGDVLFRRSIDGAFACSRYNAAMSEARYHIPVSVAYNGFDEQIFQPQPPDPALRARFAPAGAPLLLFAGRLVTFKGIDHLLDALVLLKDRPQPHLLLIGDGPHQASLETPRCRPGSERPRHIRRAAAARRAAALLRDRRCRCGSQHRPRDL